MATKDERIEDIIERAVDYIPKREERVYDPAEGLKDATRVLKAIYEARLSDYIETKQESVVFCYDLATYLQGIYPKKPKEEAPPPKKERKKRDWTPSPEAKRKSKENMWRMWSPNGNRWEAQKEEWKAEKIKNFEKGGRWEERMSLPDIKEAVENYKKSAKSAARKPTVKK